MTTPLGNKLAGKPKPTPAAAAKTSLATVLERGPRGELVDLPVLGRAWIELLGNAAISDIETDVAKRMKARGLELDDTTILTYEAERAQLTLTRSVREPDERGKAFGTLEEWGQVDADTLLAAWHAYGDVRERLAPLDVVLDPDLRSQIIGAIVKKNVLLLRSFGVNALAIFLATSESPPATSPTTTSPSGDSSSES
jgi:hypothetical protein